jgi:hypothetical protein
VSEPTPTTYEATVFQFQWSSGATLLAEDHAASEKVQRGRVQRFLIPWPLRGSTTMLG